MTQPLRYLVVGVGARAPMFTHALLGTYRDGHQLVALCDNNLTRLEVHHQELREKYKIAPLATGRPQDFAKLIKEQRVDRVIVTSIDRTHHTFICQAMELGCDVISEKPMTTDAAKCQQVLDTIERTGRKLRVTFNYRYAPRNTLVKELLAAGTIGKVLSVHFEWLLDTSHGADYFRRWHRDIRNSGGLMVHKATHHFDLVNWWLDSSPKTVFAQGDLAFYGRENAEERGVSAPYERAHGAPAAKDDRFALHLKDYDGLRKKYLEAEHEDGYQRDQNVFGSGISIQDDMSVLVRYRSRATMSYHLTAYSPWEGFRVMFNGTGGRIEYSDEESAHVHNAADPRLDRPGATPFTAGGTRVVVRPLWQKPYEVSVPVSDGGHGGGDERMLDDVFVGAQADPLGRAANHLDGARSILTGIAANQSMASGLPVDVDTLVRFPAEAAQTVTAKARRATGA
ncbi:MAG: Gfo/Idh/MocA family oxidoreductase [Planctomycetes bacterium]|nr:Gfo/Idh/MocA family oxidoreductase [Planctomycetota bacterium]